MSQKKRIYDLAKEYGMSGQDLARKLRDLGFSKVKSHMTALDDFEVLQVQGVLEAHGIVAETQSGDADSTGGGLILRKKKKKKKKAQPAEEPTEAPADEAPKELPPIEEAREEADESIAHAAEVETAPAPADEALAPEVPLAPGPELAAEAQVQIPEEAPVPEDAGETVEAQVPTEVQPTADVVEEPSAAVEPPAEIVAETEAVEEVETPAEIEPVTAEAEAGAAAELEPVEAEGAGAGEEDDESKKPKRMGKVVGFIDLSKIKTTEKKKPESRRLRSKDDVTPDVQPTMGHDRRRALMRGAGGSRGQLSATQLRERESGRFLRRRGPGGPGGRGGGRGPRRDESLGSPHRGQTLKVEAPITIRKLANTMAVKENNFLQTAWRQLGFGAVNINSLLDEDTAVLLANEYDVEIEVVHEVEAETKLVDELKKKRSGIDEGLLTVRPPAIAFLGHVDHGKTTLIDQIRRSQIAGGEAGGITQHIGAYQVKTKLDHYLTVLDTPGHAAFTAMRARGAQAVDLVVLVVAADAGVQPHTEEAINHAKAAGTPIVVAITKMDKPEANPDRVRNELSAKGLTPEDWGGETAMMPVSGITGDGVEELLERVFLESEILDLKCHPKGPAAGVVLEAEVQQGKGIVAHLLVQDGTLNRGDIILAGTGYGKVRSIHDDRSRTVESAGPSLPVEVSGLSALPGVGDSFYVVADLAKAKEVAEERNRKDRVSSLAEGRRFDRQSILEATSKPESSTINVIIRADVQGSVEVLRDAVEGLQHPEVELRILNAGVGAVPESDVLLGSTADAIIIAFNVGVNDKARAAAEKESLEIRHYQVIYNVLDDLRQRMEGTLAPAISEEVTGHVEIRKLFRSSRLGLIAGCHVLDGIIKRNSLVRLLRDGTVVHQGRLASLRRESEDAKEVREGFDCGLVLRNYQDIREGDVVETYKIVETKRTLDEARATATES